METSIILYLILTLHGTFMVGAYFMSVPFLNSLSIFDSTTYTQTDVSGIFSIIELCFALISVIIYNVSYFIKDRTDYMPLSTKEDSESSSENKQTSKVLVGFYGAFFVGSIVITLLRMGAMGIMYDLNLSTVSQGTCADVDWQTGCPTTRFNKYSSSKISNLEECNFNAYGGDGKTSTDKFTNDWALPENYDASKRSRLVSNANNALNIVPAGDVCDVGTISTDKTKCEISANDLPEIHWCWYWGCDQVCNPRYRVNHTWLVMSWFNSFFYLAIMIYLIISICQ